MDAAQKRTRKALAATIAAVDGFAAGRPLAAALAEGMREQEKLGPAERRTAAQTARAIVRELRRVDLALNVALERVGVEPRSVAMRDRVLLRYLAWRIAGERDAPERVLPELRLPFAPRTLTIGDPAAARIAFALPPFDALPEPEEPARALAQRRSVPDFLARRFVDELGLERADSVLEGLNRPARFDLRANRLIATREEVALALRGEGVETAPCALTPDGLVAADRTGLFGKTHARGLFEVQDEGSQLIAALGAGAPGMLAIDFCAGSGGKTLALAAAAGRSGRVVACDAIERRLSDLPLRARRAKAERIVEVGGARPSPELAGSADVVLVDAPCSGLGSLRREVDLRWRTSESQLDSFPPRQLEILRDASVFVRPGGRLVYATCSPFRAENEDVVAAFLRERPEFELVPADRLLPESAARAVEHGFLRTWPDTHDTGAFFAAALVRRSGA